MSDQQQPVNNLELWDSVRTPDPVYTKGFTRGGGFSGTAINPTYQIMRATEKWGPIGTGWGPEIVEERYINGAPLIHDGAVVGHEMLHTVRINLRHPGGLVPAIGTTIFVGKNKHGAFTDEEAPKKSLTDAVTKALSWLGFAADVHMGMYDDNKYVNAVARDFTEERTEAKTTPKQRRGGKQVGGAPIPPAPPVPSPDAGPWYAQHLADVQNAADSKTAAAAWEMAKKASRTRGDTAAYNVLKEAAEATSARLIAIAQGKEGAP